MDTLTLSCDCGIFVAMSEILRVRLLVGLYPDDSYPVVAGCVDELIWEAEGPEDTAARWNRDKGSFVDVDEYTWREIVVELPTKDVMRYFDTPVIKGSVDTSEPTYPV